MHQAIYPHITAFGCIPLTYLIFGIPRTTYTPYAVSIDQVDARGHWLVQPGEEAAARRKSLHHVVAVAVVAPCERPLSRSGGCHGSIIIR